jgi:hypothetical protein
MKTLHFQENQRVDGSIMALLGAGAVLEAYLAVTLWRTSHMGAIISALSGVLILVVAIPFRQLTIRVTDEDLSFGFGIFRKRIRISDISGVSITEASLTTTGIGIHYCPGRVWAWVAKSGAAIKVSLSTGNIAGYLISTDRPLDLSSAITALTLQQAKPDGRW